MSAEQTTPLTGVAAILEQSFCEVCDELGCEYDNEAALLAAARLRAAVDYCRKRLKRPEYQAELERILAGERDDLIASPDHTQVTHG